MRFHRSATDRTLRLAAVLAVCAFALAACSSGTPTAGGAPSPTGGATESPASTESPVAPEHNPPGDIPDSQVFVAYRASGGFSLRYPEGWSRTNTSSSVSFTDKLNTVKASWGPASSAPTADSARSQDVPTLRKTERAFQLRAIETVTLPAGPAVLITYRANSDPNSVTGRQYRLDVLRFELYRSGVEVMLTLSSPVGADNVDPWRIVSRSVAWG